MVQHASERDGPAHRLLALWAADCAEHVLHRFAEECPEDQRPRLAIEAARAWARGETTVQQTREAALAAHAAARETRGSAARAAARAAGHAAATAHVADHARHAADYAAQAASDACAEGEWQQRRRPDHLGRGRLATGCDQC
jgi:hypothetical protein